MEKKLNNNFINNGEFDVNDMNEVLYKDKKGNKLLKIYINYDFEEKCTIKRCYTCLKPYKEKKYYQCLECKKRLSTNDYLYMKCPKCNTLMMIEKTESSCSCNSGFVIGIIPDMIRKYILEMFSQKPNLNKNEPIHILNKRQQVEKIDNTNEYRKRGINEHKKWTKGEEEKLAKYWNNGKTIFNISKKLGRTTHAIKLRLIKKNLLHEGLYNYQYNKKNRVCNECKNKIHKFNLSVYDSITNKTLCLKCHSKVKSNETKNN